MDNVANGVQPLHPASATGCTRRGNGCSGFRDEVQRLHPNLHTTVRRTFSASACEATAGRGHGVATEATRVYVFFAALGSRWLLTIGQRHRLAPAVRAALAAGWTPAGLTEVTGGNTGGIRSPFAAVAARLSPGELPAPPRQARARPPWCGTCDPVTRMLDFDGDAPRPCPRCKPAAPRLSPNR